MPYCSGNNSFNGRNKLGNAWRSCEYNFCFAVGVLSAVALTTAIVAISGGDVVEGITNAAADAVFLGGIFSFVSAGVNAVKAGVRVYRSYQDRLVSEYIKRYALNDKDAENIAKSFTGKVRLKTSNGRVKAHRYYDNIQAFEKGRYLTNKPTDNPIRDLVLYKNQATSHTVLRIERGRQYLVGKIAKSPVTAIQYFVADVNWLIK